jgi:hypothetical protein
VRLRQRLPDAISSIRREVLLRFGKTGASIIGLRRKSDKLLIVALGLHPISGPFGGLSGARKRAIAVGIVAQ